MTVQAQNSVQYYKGPIEIGTELSIVEFTFIDNSHVSAKVRGNTEVWKYGYDYTISGAQTLIRTITVQRRVAENEVLAVYLDVPITQNISPEEGGNFPASTNEYVLDKLTHISQMLDERVKRSLQISIDTPFSGTLPAPEPNKALKISPDGNSFVMSDYDPDTALVLTEQYRSEAQQSAAAAKTSQNAAKTSENNAKASATTATQKADKVESIYAQAVPELNNIINNGVTTLSNASNALRTTQITNCITEAPQRVKYTLVDGVLNVNKGSVFILPFGTENKSSAYPIGSTFESNFKVVDSSYYAGRFYLYLESLGNVNYSSTSASTLDHLIGYFVKTKSRYNINTRDCHSGTTVPTLITNNNLWYDTASNFIKYTNNKGETWHDVWATFPLLEVSRGSDLLWKRVLNIFNGVGIFGSELWLDKGVKGLIGKDYNTDGTLKNIEFTTSTIVTVSRDLTQKSVTAWYRNQQKAIIFSTGFYYDETVNSTIRIDNGNKEEFCHIATVDINAGVLSNLRIRKPIHLLDKFDFDNTNMIGKPQMSLDDYLPQHCIWLEGQTISRTTYPELFKIYGTTYGAGDGSTTFKIPDFRNRAIWGSNTFGYLNAGLPNIIGRSLLFPANDDVAPNAFQTMPAQGSLKVYGATDNRGAGTNALGFNASKYSSIYGASTTVQPPAIKVRVYARYK